MMSGFLCALFVSLCLLLPAVDSESCDEDNPCEHGGTCYVNVHDGKLKCQCPTGYRGGHCEHPDLCNPHTICQHGGTCYKDTNHIERCHCQAGYVGDRCEGQNLTTTTSHVTSPTSTTTASIQPQTTHGPVSTTRSPACSSYNPVSHPCKDNSACSLPHVQGVICPDPNEAHYCPVTCGCCLLGISTPIVFG